MTMLRSEHPNPQMVRENWMNLNGTWEFEIDHGVSGKERRLFEAEKLEREIVVPFCPESKLSGIGYTDFMDCVWYKRNVEIPNEWSKGHVILHFGAVDYEATVYINGVEAGTHMGGYSSFSFDISNYIQKGENSIIVCAVDDTRSGMQPTGKQSTAFASSGCTYTRTTGIWQTVWLEYVPNDYIKTMKFFPNPENASVMIHAELAGTGLFNVKAFFEGNLMGEASVQSIGQTVEICVPLKEKHLWEAGAGRLYDLEICFGEDCLKSYFGLRSIRFDGLKFMLNGKSVFQRLVLDQGFYPDGIYTAQTDEALINDIRISMDMGFNGARLHEKIFEQRFLYHADRLGYMVWGEHANWGIDHSDIAALSTFLPEWVEAVERDFNHPSIVGWCPFNETWDYDDRRQNDKLISVVYDVTKALDPTRPCIDTSGNYHVRTDIFCVHNYEQNVEIFKSSYDKLMTENVLFDSLSEKRQTYKGEPTFVSEYGGMSWSMEPEQNGWGYGEAPKTQEEFLARYKGLTDALLDNDKMFGFCYTQLTDVEQEINGLYTYERTAKFDPAIIKAINERKAAIED